MEEEFARRIESDLHSKHQPSLLPFLKVYNYVLSRQCLTLDSAHWVWFLQDSVPHLKTRLQLQQVIMKELLQKIIAEKRNTNAHPFSLPPSSTAAASVSLQTSQSGSTAIAPQPVTAVQVTTSNAGPTSGGPNKPVTVVGSKVTVGSMMLPNSASQLQLLPQTFSPAALESLSMQLPKPLRDKITKLPQEQQKFVYLHHLRQLQQLKEQQSKQLPLPQLQPSLKVISEKQRQLVQEQQIPLVVGVAKPGGRGVSATVSVGSSTTEMMKGKSNFATMKILPGGSSLGVPKRRGKGKDSGGVDME